MQRMCRYCGAEATAINLDFYHDCSVCGAEPVCDNHSVADLPTHDVQYDDYGYSIYRPDPVSVPIAMYNEYKKYM